MANIVIELPIEDDALAMRLERLAERENLPTVERLDALVAARLAEVCHTAAAFVRPVVAPPRFSPTFSGCITPEPKEVPV